MNPLILTVISILALLGFGLASQIREITSNSDISKNIHAVTFLHVSLNLVLFYILLLFISGVILSEEMVLLDLSWLGLSSDNSDPNTVEYLFPLFIIYWLIVPFLEFPQNGIVTNFKRPSQISSMEENAYFGKSVAQHFELSIPIPGRLNYSMTCHIISVLIGVLIITGHFARFNVISQGSIYEAILVVIMVSGLVIFVLISGITVSILVHENTNKYSWSAEMALKKGSWIHSFLLSLFQLTFSIISRTWSLVKLLV